VTKPAAVPQVAPPWNPCLRLIASRFPTVGLFDRIADPADLDLVGEIESLTNPRLRDELGHLHLVPASERLTGPGATPVMAAFTHLNPEGSRFSAGQYGVYYAANGLDTALAEVGHHRTLFMARTQEPAMDLDLRLLSARVVQPLHDLRSLPARADAAVHDPADYAAAQRLGQQLRAAGSWGVLYRSVRWAGGQCVGLFRPRALAPAQATRHLVLHWDGQRMSHWYEKRALRSLQGLGL
jgi:hypothetical protein